MRLGHQGRRVDRQDQKDPQEILVQLVQLKDRQDHLDPPEDHLEIRGHLEVTDPLDHLEAAEDQGHQDHRGQKAQAIVTFMIHLAEMSI